jgi:chlorite dismutase
MDQKAPQQQFVRYAFYKVDPAWRSLPEHERDCGREELVKLVEGFSDRMILRSYSTAGTRGDCDFLLWQVTYNIDDLQQLATAVNRSFVGRYLSLPYSYLALTKRSVYVDKHVHEGQEGRMRAIRPSESRYFFVYPFVKSRPWYLLSIEERQRLMNTHIEIGHKYPRVKLNTTYSFGLDDQEFVVAFESDYPTDFLDLVMELRETESSLYTIRDTPTFTCLRMPLMEALQAVG